MDRREQTQSFRERIRSAIILDGNLENIQFEAAPKEALHFDFVDELEMPAMDEPEDLWLIDSPRSQSESNTSPRGRMRSFSNSESGKPEATATHNVSIPFTVEKAHIAAPEFRSPRQTYTQLSTVRKFNIPEWLSIKHVDVIHRQGLRAPSFLLSRVKDARPYFQLFCPKVDPDIPILICRKKLKEMKFRFSTSSSNLGKKNNPDYVGKMSREDCLGDRIKLSLSLANGVQVAYITLETNLNTKTCRVEMLDQYLNLQEPGRAGRLMGGMVQSFLQPRIRLTVNQSKRHILEYKRVDRDFDSDRMQLSLDYPLTPFLGFAICVAVECWTELIETNPTSRRKPMPRMNRASSMNKFIPSPSKFKMRAPSISKFF